MEQQHQQRINSIISSNIITTNKCRCCSRRQDGEQNLKPSWDRCCHSLLFLEGFQRRVLLGKQRFQLLVLEQLNTKWRQQNTSGHSPEGALEVQKWCETHTNHDGTLVSNLSEEKFGALCAFLRSHQSL